jgi:hypothetical protein
MSLLNYFLQKTINCEFYIDYIFIIIIILFLSELHDYKLNKFKSIFA